VIERRAIRAVTGEDAACAAQAARAPLLPNGAGLVHASAGSGLRADRLPAGETAIKIEGRLGKALTKHGATIDELVHATALTPERPDGRSRPRLLSTRRAKCEFRMSCSEKW
jgi:hypothetical protein